MYAVQHVYIYKYDIHSHIFLGNVFDVGKRYRYNKPLPSPQQPTKHYYFGFYYNAQVNTDTKHM